MPTKDTYYGGELNAAKIIEKRPVGKVVLTTYYPLDKEYKIGHSMIRGSDSNHRFVFNKNTNALDKNYCLFSNNCSDDTIRIIESLSGKKAPSRLFTTPGTTRDFVKSIYGNDSDYRERRDAFGRIHMQQFTVPDDRIKHVSDSLRNLHKLQYGGTVNYNSFPKKYRDNFKYIDGKLKNAGYGYNQRLAILGNIQRESQGNPLAISSNGLWHGIIQWNKDRYQLQSNNEKTELKTQTNLLLKELEKTGWSGNTWKDQLYNLNAFKNAKDLKEATRIFTKHFVRPSNLESEIQKRFDFAFNARHADSEYDENAAFEVLPVEQINAWKNDPENNHLPAGYEDQYGNYHYLKSSQHESYPETQKEELSTGVMMHYNPYPENYVSKFLTYNNKPMGLPWSINMNSQKQKNMVEIKQMGGTLIYTPFIKDRSNVELYEFLNDSTPDKFPVSAVETETPMFTTEQQSVEPEVEPDTKIIDTETTNKPVSTEPAIDNLNQNINFNDNDLKILSTDGSNKDKRRVATKYLQQKLNLTKEQASALVGIWQAESGFNLNAENKAEKAGKNTSVKANQYGIGIGQWTHDRHENYVNYINNHGGSHNLQNQLDFAIDEIKTKYPDFLNNLRNSTNVKDATAYAYVQYVGANEKNIKDTADLYSRVNKTVNRYRIKHQSLYGKSSNGFEKRLKFAIDNLNI